MAGAFPGVPSGSARRVGVGYRRAPGGAGVTCFQGPGSLNTDTTGTRCVTMHWPASQSAYDQRHQKTPVETWAWQGSLVEDQRDGSGWSYRRARLVDPLTGRFTQVDPIGVAGGLNLYGFANGDPVNFSDPFGLCPPKESCRLLELLRASGEQRLVLGRIPVGPRTIGGYAVNVKKETAVQLERSRTTGNALITAVGEIEFSNVYGPFDATLLAAGFDVGTQDFEAHGAGPLGYFLTPVHVRGNAKQGVTGVCILFCFPVPEKKKDDDRKATP